MTERAYKFRFFTTTEQENLFLRTMGCVGLVYNKALATRTEALYEKQEGFNTKKPLVFVAKILAKIKDARTDFLHKLTTDLVKNNSLIAIEDLVVRNMVKNHKLARSISDAAWGEMFRQLEYECEWCGRKLVKIDRFFPSSKRCNYCGFVIDKLQTK